MGGESVSLAYVSLYVFPYMSPYLSPYMSPYMCPYMCPYLCLDAPAGPDMPHACHTSQHTHAHAQEAQNFVELCLQKDPCQRPAPIYMVRHLYLSAPFYMVRVPSVSCVCNLYGASSIWCVCPFLKLPLPPQV